MSKPLKFPTPSKQMDEKKLLSFISKVVGNELSNMLSPCAKTKFVPYKNDLIAYTGVDDKLIAQLKSQFVFLKQQEVMNDNFTLKLIILIIYFIRNKKQNVAEYLFLFLALKFYSSLVHKYFRFCNSDVWNTALNNLSIKHLFRVHGSISSAVMYLSKEVFSANKALLLNPSLTEIDIMKIVFSLRHRINQSLNSFAKMYYYVWDHKQTMGLETQQTEDTRKEENEGIQVVADKLSISICTYGTIDHEALEKAISISGMRRDLAVDTVKSFSSVEWREEMLFIIVLIDRIEKLNTLCMDSGRNKVIKKINSDKIKIGNYSVRDKILDLLYGLENNFSLKTINTNQLVLFFLQYITIFIRKRVC